MKWKSEKRNLKDLKESEKNPRRLTKEQAMHLEESISKFGLCEPIVINSDGTIIGGHQRVRTLKKLGHKEADVYVPSEPLDEKQCDELNIRLNKNTGEWDFDMISSCWDVEDLVSWGFSIKEFGVHEEEDEDQERSSSPTITIRFSSAEQLQEAENKISLIIDEFQGATYKKKI